nr:MAG TPA: hypothetical protein [Caudoviricetes sp.]
MKSKIITEVPSMTLNCFLPQIQNALTWRGGFKLRF